MMVYIADIQRIRCGFSLNSCRHFSGLSNVKWRPAFIYLSPPFPRWHTCVVTWLKQVKLMLSLQYDLNGTIIIKYSNESLIVSLITRPTHDQAVWLQYDNSWELLVPNCQDPPAPLAIICKHIFLRWWPFRLQPDWPLFSKSYY
jgi:hypothetical protein